MCCSRIRYFICNWICFTFTLKSKENILFTVKNIDTKTKNSKQFYINHKTYIDLSHMDIEYIKLTQEEYQEIEQYVYELDLNGYMQDLENDEEKYVPDFDSNNKM